MALEITRPIGSRYTTTPVTATVTDSFMYAQFNRTAHGLSTGDRIIVTSGPYAGRYVIDTDNVNTFFAKVNDNPGTDFIAYQGGYAAPYVFVDYEHMWSSVHLPIVYEIESSLYPYSNQDNRSISSFDNREGYMRLTLSGGLTGVIYLDFVRITGAASPELNGIFQVALEIEGGNKYTIDLAYDSGYNKTGAVVTPYYNNYAVLVHVYAGWPGVNGAGLPGFLKRATLRFRPDNNNKVRFSISDVLKGFIESVNDLGPQALPNNYHNAVQFYLRYQEAWDEADVTDTIIPWVSEETSDEGEYEGVAVNCKLPFKNQYSGYLSDYLMNVATAKFLTLFSVPVLFACSDSDPTCYQDISFLYTGGILTLQREYMRNGQIITTVTDDIETNGLGVYRVPLIREGISACAYDEVRLQLINSFSPSVGLDIGNQIGVNSEDDADWDLSDLLSIEAVIDLDIPIPSTKIIYGDVSIPPGSYSIDYNMNNTQPGTPVSFYLAVLNASLDVIHSSMIETTTGEITGTKSFTISEQAEHIGVYAMAESGGVSDPTIYIYDFQFSAALGDVSEKKRIRIDCGCANQLIKLCWLNNLGGYDYWTFKANKEYMVEIVASGETETNLLPAWPSSYDDTASTIRRNTYRYSRNQILIRSGYVSEDEVKALAYIKSSILVQIIEGKSLRTVIVDTNSFVVYRDDDKLRTIEFTVTFTDDIPAQTT